MKSDRRGSCEDIPSSHCSPMSSSSEEASKVPTNSSEEAVHYPCDFLDHKLVDDTLVSRVLLTSDSLQELDAKDVLEQELKMKREHLKRDSASTLPKVLNKETTSSPKNPNPESKSKSAGRRCRTHFTPTQLDLLETTFQAQSYPSSSLRQQMHEITGIPKDNIKVWFQNRRAREKRRKEKSQRKGPSSTKAASNDATTLSTTSSPPRPIPMTTMSMHWPEDSTDAISSAPPPRYHPYQPQWNNPSAQNRRNWYWANAYHPLEQSSTTPNTASPVMDSFKPATCNAVTYPIPQIQSIQGSLPPIPSIKASLPPIQSIKGSLPQIQSIQGSAPSFAQLQPSSLPPRTSSAAAGERFVNTTSDLHPWSTTVLTSL